MYERFTDRARKIMQLANVEAQRFNHEYIGTEHILLGLVKEGAGVAANILKDNGIDLRKVRLELEKLHPARPDMVTMGKLPQTPRAKKVIEYALEEARTLGHNYVGTEHLLLGLLREQEGPGAQILMNLGLRLEKLREETLDLLAYDPEQAPNVSGAAARFKDHPLVRQFILALEEIQKVKNSTIRSRQERELQERLNQLLRTLSENPAFGRIIEDCLATYCCEVGWPAEGIIDRTEVEQTAQSLVTGRPVVLVGAPGSGRRTIARLVNRHFLVNSETAHQPRQLIAPNHLRLEDGEDGYSDNLFRTAETLRASSHYFLAIADLEIFCDTDLTGASRVEAWKQVLSEFASARRSWLGWTTPAGRDEIARRWPGVWKEVQPIVLQPLSEDKLLRIVMARIKELGSNRKSRFERDFAELLLERRQEWRGETDVSDPGRVLELLARVVDFDQGREETHELPATPEPSEVVRLREVIQRSLEADDLILAQRLLTELKRFQKRRPTLPKPRGRRLIPSNRIHEYMGSLG